MSPSVVGRHHQAAARLVPASSAAPAPAAIAALTARARTGRPAVLAKSLIRRARAAPTSTSAAAAASAPPPPTATATRVRAWQCIAQVAHVHASILLCCVRCIATTPAAGTSTGETSTGVACIGGQRRLQHGEGARKSIDVMSRQHMETAHAAAHRLHRENMVEGRECSGTARRTADCPLADQSVGWAAPLPAVAFLTGMSRR